MERLIEDENDGFCDSDDNDCVPMSRFDWAALDISIWMDVFYFDLDKLVRTI